MKKLFFTVAAIAALAVTSYAEAINSFSFIAPQYQALQCSNAIRGLTNLYNSTILSNYNGVLFTNYGGSFMISSNGSSPGPLVNMFTDVPIPNGRLVPGAIPASATVTNDILANFVVTVTGAAGAGGTLTLRIAPIVDERGNTGTAQSVAITATASTKVVSVTPLQAPTWGLAKGIRVLDVFSGDTDANSGMWIHSIDLVGWYQ